VEKKDYDPEGFLVHSAVARLYLGIFTGLIFNSNKKKGHYFNG